jgi:hypothetical protein
MYSTLIVRDDRVIYNGVEYILTFKQYNILHAIVDAKDRHVKPAEICIKINEPIYYSETIKWHVAQIRKKLNDRSIIEHDRGFGYIINRNIITTLSTSTSHVDSNSLITEQIDTIIESLQELKQLLVVKDEVKTSLTNGSIFTNN